MSKIKSIIFDFGDVFINLDKDGAMTNALQLFQMEYFEDDILLTNIAYETGQITTIEFIDFYNNKFKNLDEKKIVEAWNYILRDFPEYRLKFLKDLKEKKDFSLILLSNTNELHIESVKNNVPFYEEFKACFNGFYLSHEIKKRKPNKDIFEFVLNEHNLIPKECLFIDDTYENTKSASQMGLHVWNIDERTEDVIHLFDIKKDLF
ncbi:HAD-IA family hydrolase [Winogradskyella sp. DF17]|uniref:HAD-IA family hydrolase n=1 Tax=Winogradskyella pelagia TaxID=2819984 RepID=A0ABS3T3N2_9FLAO|nr:HAD-IA family hydrolase [Winogradskyella sp. DF17]MBO3117342.1 HAD-IA family hydrolase [Winogradskyella sp. DF17]